MQPNPVKQCLISGRNSKNFMKYIRPLFHRAVPLAAVFSLMGAAYAQKPASVAPPKATSATPVPVIEGMSLTPQTRKQVFEAVWNRVNDRYYDQTFGGVNWKGVHTKYAPRVVKPQSDGDFYGLLQTMLGELKRSHFNIIPPDRYTAEDSVAALTKPEPKTPDSTPTSPTSAAPDATARDGKAAFEIRLVENEPTVWKVTKGSGADLAGVKTGYIVTSLRDKPLAPIMEQMRKTIKEPGELAMMVRHGLGQALVGAVGSRVSVGVLDENNQPKTLLVKRDPIPGVSSKFGELPTLNVQTESRILDNNVGYVSFNIFLMPVLEPTRAAISHMQAQNVSGLIVDLRGNPGGIGVLSSAIAGSLFPTRTDLGVMALRGGMASFPVFPSEKPYTGPLVFLTDEGSASTSEIMAGSFQELGRAVVVGQKTAGAVMPSSIETLPGTRARLQYAFADFKTPKGTLLEGRGVLPDVPVSVTRRALLEGRDPELDAALAYLKTAPKNGTVAVPINPKKVN